MRHASSRTPALSVVIPAYDEARRLPRTIDHLGTFLAAAADLRPAQIVVVDDGSRDGTAEAVGDRSCPDGVELEIVRHDANRGKGAAVRTGFGRSRGAFVLVSDADLATPIEEVRTLWAAGGADVVAIGSRAVDRSRIAVRQPWYRDLMGRIFNLAVRTLAVPGVLDTQCGFKLIPGDVARALAEAMTVDGFAWDVELLILVRRWGLEVREVPVTWRHVEESRVEPVRHSAEMLADLLRLGARRAFGRLPGRPAGARSDGSP